MKSTKMLTILVLRNELLLRVAFVLVLGLMVSPAQVGQAEPMGTAFTYQGRLMDANDAADGIYDFQFVLFDDPIPGVGILQGYIDVNDLDVIDGYFTVELDFNEPNAFMGDRRWLEIAVRPGDSNDPNAFVKLSPRNEVTPTPYALYAKSAGLQAPIQVSGSFDFPKAVIEATNTSTSNGYAIAGVQADKGTVGYMGGYYGVYGRHDGNLNYGYLGGSDYGVYGRNINENHGYLGSASYGVYGSSISRTAAYFTSSSGYGLIVESGKVGIGTTSPDALLEVAGASSNLGLISTSGLSPFITFDHLGSLGSGSTIGSLNFKWGVPNPVAGILAKAGSNAVTQDSAHLTFRTASAGISLERMRIDENGNVGIGTLSPSKDLEVISKSIGGGIKVYGDASTGSHDSPGFHLGGKDVGGNNRAGDLSLALSDGHFSSNAVKGDLVLRAEDTNIRFSTQSSGGFPAKMTIKSDGNVGIGTANPYYPLEVKRSADSIFAASVENESSTGHGLSVRVGSSGTEGAFQIYRDEGIASTLVKVEANGNVGIGTANPPTVLALGTEVNPIISVASTNSNDFTFLGLAGGGSMSYDRGSSIALHGNEHTNKGTMWLRVGWDPSTMTGANDGDLIIETAHTERFRIDKDGNIGIGTTNPASRLHVAGGCITGSMCSDIRLKKNIEPLPSDESILDRVMGLEAVTFEWKHREDGKRQIGLIAQDVEVIFPEVVTTPDDGTCEKGLLATGMDAVLVEAIKELKAENESLKEQLKNQNQLFEQKIKALESKIERRFCANVKKI